MKVSVAIITMHSVKNFGSYLQAIATYNIFKERGYNPFIVDYFFPNEIHLRTGYYRYKRKSIEEKTSFFKRLLRYLCKRYLRVNNEVRSKCFDDFYQEVLFSRHYSSSSELSSNIPQADIYVSGSDQIWNPDYVGTDTSFLLSWAPEEKTKISLASSFANTELPNELVSTYKQYLSRYNSISIREESKKLQDLLGIKADVVLDPTMWITKDLWKKQYIKEPIIKEDYIACYILGYAINPYPFVYKLISKIKKSTGCKRVVIIDGHPEDILKGYRIVSNIGPREFLNILYYSKYIISSSFHGTAFAINFEKPFSSLVSNKFSDNRQKSLLKMLSLEDRMVELNSEILPTMTSSSMPPYMEKLDELRRKSNDFLNRALVN